MEQIASVAEISVEQLIKAGFQNLDDLRNASDEEISEKLSLTQNRIAELRSAISFLTPVIEGNEE